jgi:DNA-binding NtrC family response regulator
MCEGDMLTIRDFSFPGFNQFVENSDAANQTPIFDLDEVERITIVKALQQTGYKKTETAQLLNITRQSLDRRLEKHGLQF